MKMENITRSGRVLISERFTHSLIIGLAFCVVFLLVVLPAGLCVDQDVITLKQQQLHQTERFLKNNLDKLEQTEEKERTLLVELERLDFKIELINTQVRLLSLEQESLDQEKTEIVSEIAHRKTQIRQQELIICKRLKALYKRGEWTALRLFFNTHSISDIAHNLKLMKFIATEDLNLMNEHRRYLNILSLRETELITVEKDLARSSAEIARNNKENNQNRRMKEILLEQVRNKKEDYEQRCARLEQNRSELENWLKEHSDVPLKGSFQSLKKHLPWPVQGKIKRFFGRQINARFMTSTFSNGLLIAAEEGTPVCVIADGQVMYAGWFQGYGNLIIIQHINDFFSLYGHLSEIMVSAAQKVSELSIIGRVGDTGSDSGFVLYFELRDKGIPQDPVKWLSAEKK
ncbi:peptidoglycan DD-metalloendopeptidase family protein [bacterium]|nr:peptidoglycan DD-metalloendopeptidase family protein [bacterium]